MTGHGAGPQVRHPVTEKAWEWFEGPEGQSKPPNVQKAIRERLECLDADLIEFDAAWPRTEASRGE